MIAKRYVSEMVNNHNNNDNNINDDDDDKNNNIGRAMHILVSTLVFISSFFYRIFLKIHLQYKGLHYLYYIQCSTYTTYNTIR